MQSKRHSTNFTDFCTLKICLLLSLAATAAPPSKTRACQKMFKEKGIKKCLHTRKLTRDYASFESIRMCACAAGHAEWLCGQCCGAMQNGGAGNAALNLIINYRARKRV